MSHKIHDKKIIKPINDKFSWGKSPNLKVIIMNKNKYINCTKMCQYISQVSGSKKLFRHWSLLSGAKELINETSKNINISVDKLMIIIA